MTATSHLVPSPLYPWNRKYLGAKTALLPWLLERFQSLTDGCIGSFCDPMAGTGVVAYAVSSLPSTTRIAAGDILVSNTIPLRVFLLDGVEFESAAAAIEDLRMQPPLEGYVWRHFGGRYFSHENAAHMDAIRERIQQEEDPRLADAMLTSLLYAADKAANTVGQFDAYMKNLHAPAKDSSRHLVDSNALKPLDLRVPVAVSCKEPIVETADACDLLSRHAVDTVYLDPPYNTRQYSDLYHVLENIARWEKPAVHGVTRKFHRDHLRSRFSSRATAAVELARVCSIARCKHLFLSYSSEGIIPHEHILRILSGFGPVTISESEYPVFGRGAGRARKRTVIERLYYVRKH
ncbi:MAG: DNA adenine methylase [Fimbriimonadia bacterium]|jgi:adenine-specific DNA-methyltransferase